MGKPVIAEGSIVQEMRRASSKRGNVTVGDHCPPGAVEEIARIVARIRQEWPRVGIILRADSGFSNDELGIYGASTLFDVTVAFCI